LSQKKVSKERRALRAALHLALFIAIANGIRVVLARSRLAMEFCALNSFRGVGVEGRWGGLAALAHAPGLAFADGGDSACGSVVNPKPNHIHAGE
jgi:hypothetical protein